VTGLHASERLPAETLFSLYCIQLWTRRHFINAGLSHALAVASS
jgi:hypothetical protein